MKYDQCRLDAGIPESEQRDLFGDEVVDQQIIDSIQSQGLAVKAAEEARFHAIQVKRQKAMKILKTAQLDKQIRSHKKGILNGVKSLLTRDKFGLGGNVSLEQTANAHLGFYHSKLAAMIEDNKASIVRTGKRMLGGEVDQTLSRNIVKEMYKEGSSGDALAAAHAKSITQVFEEMRQHFNRAGGAIKKLDGAWLPQRHDSIKVGKVTEDQWINKIWDKLDRKKMVDKLGRPLSDDQLRVGLREAYRQIRTDGAYKMDPAAMGGTGKISSKLANRHQEHRFIHFKDGDSWLEYQAEFGAPDIIASVQDHIHMMTTEIAALEVLGPDPDSMVKFLANLAEKERTVGEMFDPESKPDRLTRAREIASADVESIYDNVMGRTSLIKNDAANLFATIRNYNVVTKLGGAFISAFSDHGFMVSTASLNDMQASGVYRNYLKGLNPNNAEHRMAATRLGVVAEYAADRAISAHRYSEVVGYGFAADLSDFTMRASFLHAHTVAMKQAFQMEYLSSLAKDIDKSFDQLSPRRKQAFARYGITEADWDAIKKVDMEDIKGVKFVNPTKMDMEQMVKFQGLVQSETKLAVLEPDAYDRAVLNRGSKAGTMMGEINRSTFQFKSFPLAVVTNHLARATMDGRMGAGDRIAYMSNTIILTTVLGAVALQAKEIAKGNDMQEQDEAFWLRAFAQGGGMGLLGDLMTKPMDQWDQSMFAVMGGPAGGMVEDLVNSLIIAPPALVAAKYMEAGEEIEAKYGKKIADAFKRNFPLNNLWYTRLIMERALFDNVGRAVDPKWDQRQGQRLKWMERERGQEKWWNTENEIRLPKAPDQLVPGQERSGGGSFKPTF